MRKIGVVPSHPLIIGEEHNHVPSKAWTEMIRKVYEVDPLICPTCGGQARVIAFITDYSAVDRIITQSTFLGVAQAGGLLDKEGQPINVGRAMLVDAFSTTFSGLFGTSSGTTYIESAAGIEERGMEIFGQEDVAEIAVLENKKLIGVIKRKDAKEAYNHEVAKREAASGLV